MSIPRKRINQLYNNIDSWVAQRRALEFNTSYKGEHFHLALLFQEKCKKSIDPLIYGYNYCVSGKDGSIHAEADILNKALRDRYIDHKAKYSVIIMRTTMMNSRPCKNCIERLASENQIRIKYVYYSIDKTFMRVSIKELFDNYECAHVSKYNRRRHIKH
jgi:cytidine deaminase